MTKKISIAMATYNGGRFLKEQLDSLYKQTRVPDEVVVSDDGSTDDTLAILEGYGIKARRREGEEARRREGEEARGRVNRNFFNALQATTGDYICICDQDDIWLPEKIETLAAQMDRMDPTKPNCVSSLRNDMDADGHIYHTPKEEVQTSGWQATLLTYGRNQGCTLMINSVLLDIILQKIEVYPELLDRMYYDELISYSAVIVGEKVNLPIALMNYRHHEGNAVDPAHARYSFREKVEHLPTLYGLLVDERFDPLCAIRKAFEKEIHNSKLKQFLDEIAAIMDEDTTGGKWRKAIRISALTRGERMQVAIKSAMSIALKKIYGYPTLRATTPTKRILFIAHYLRDNGTERYMMQVVRSMKAEGYAFDFVIFSDEDTANRREAEALGCTIYCLPARKAGATYYTQLKAWFSAHAQEYDWVHWCGGTLSSILPIRMAHRYGMRVIVHAHNSNSTGWHNRVLHYLHRCAATRIASQRLACSESAGHYFFGTHSYQVVRNGIDMTQYRYQPTKRQAVRKQLGIGEKEHIIGIVGRLEEVKNPGFALQVVAQMSGVRLMVVGDGSLRTELQVQAQALGIADRVVWMGQVANVGELMQAMDVLVMPSQFEGLPFVLVEAQTAGLPCIVSENVAEEARITDLVQVVEMEANRWAEVINQWLMNYKREDKREAMREKGFDSATLKETMTSIYNRL